MAKHHYVIPGFETEANGFVQSISDENRAHVEIVSHDQAFETKFVAQQLCNNAARHGGRRGLRLEGWVPPVADHHTVYNPGRRPRRSRPTNEFAKHGQLITIKLLPSAIYPGQLKMRI